MKSLSRHFQQLSNSSPLTQHQLAQTNLLLPRLCLSGHLDAAVHLAITALLANPPPHSVSLAALLDTLASQPDMAAPMSLLTRLRHAPPSHHRHVAPAATFLAASYFKKSRPKEALKLFHWFVRPGSPFVVDPKLAGVFISGFFRNGMVFESVKVLRAVAVAGDNGVLRSGYGKLVCRGLLREARLNEAMVLSEALEGNEVKNVLEVLDRTIEDWTE